MIKLYQVLGYLGTETVKHVNSIGILQTLPIESNNDKPIPYMNQFTHTMVLVSIQKPLKPLKPLKTQRLGGYTNPTKRQHPKTMATFSILRKSLQGEATDTNFLTC